MTGKHERYDAVAAVKKEVKTALAEDYVGREKEVGAALEELESETLRTLVIRENRRVDGRGLTDIRPITCEVGILPRTHGSALFTRGETQALVIATLGTSSDEQKVDALIGEQFKRFMLHYNFPPFSVGEARPLRSPGRREIGHGALAERAATSRYAGRKRISLHHSCGGGGIGIEWFFFDGNRVWRYALVDGRRRTDQSSGGRDCHGAYQGRRRDSYPE